MNFLSSLFTLPSLPVLPTSYLPSLPSLPQNLQRRFLSYVLKKSLGHLVKDGALDPERIEAQVTTGHVEVKGVELDEEAINCLIPAAVPLRLQSGLLGTLSANLGSGPATPWHPAAGASSSSSSTSSTYAVNVALSHLHLDFVFDPPSASASADGSQHSDAAPGMADLANSVLSVADDFVHSELDAQEEQELLDSVRTLRRDQHLDPFVSPDSEPVDEEELWLPPGSMRPYLDKPTSGVAAGGQGAPAAEEAKTLVMGFVEGVLARLKVNVKDVRVRVRFNTLGNGGIGAEDPGKRPVELELRMTAVSYQDESSTSVSSDPGTTGARSKVLRFSSLNVALLHRPASPSPPPFATSPPSLRSSTSTILQPPDLRRSQTSDASFSSSSSSGGDPHATLLMSQAIADLRDSTLNDSSESMYESATEGGSGDFLTPSPMEEERGPFLVGTATTAPAQAEAEEDWRTLLSACEEDIVFRFSSSGSSIARSGAPTMQRTSSSASGEASTKAPSRLPSTSLHRPGVHARLPAITALILPQQVEPLSRVLSALLAGDQAGLDSPTSPSALAGRPSPHLTLELRSILLIAVYTNEDLADTVLQGFWAKPREGHLPAGHLALKIGRIEAYSCPPTTSPRRPSRTTERPPTSSSQPRSSPSPTSSPSQAVFIEDFSLFEHLSPSVLASSADAGNPSPAVAPIFIVDPELPNQYDMDTEDIFPTFDSQDWRSGARAGKAGAVEQAWRVRSGRAKFAAGNSSPADVGPALHFARSSVLSERTTFHLLPLHVFLDLALVERLLPFLRTLSPLSSNNTPLREVDDWRPSARSKAASDILESLDAEFSTAPNGPSARPPAPAPSTLYASFIRLDIRCPAPAASKGIGDGSFIRSGILTLDIHHLVAQVLPTVSSSKPSFTSSQIPSHQLEWRKAHLLYLPISQSRAQTFLTVGLSAAADSPDAAADGPPLLPRVQLFLSSNPPSFRSQRRTQSAAQPNVVKCSLPSIQADMGRAAAEGLQYLVDDTTQWLNGAFGDGSRPCPREDIKLIGSRFFGAKYSSVSSSSDDEAAPSSEPPSSAMPSLNVVTVEITDMDITLRAPRTTAPSDPPRVMHFWAAETLLTFDTSVHLKKESILCLAVGDIKAQDLSHLEAPVKIFERTSNRGLESRPRPILSLQLISSVELDLSSRTTDVEVTLYNCTFLTSADLAWTGDLAGLSKPPVGAFEDLEPSDTTRISLLLDETSIHFAAPTLPGAMVLNLQNMLASTELHTDASAKFIGITADEVHLLLIDNMQAPAPELKPKSKLTVPAPLSHWTNHGYAHLLQVSNLKAIIDAAEFDPQTKVDIIRMKVRMQACPDSLPTLGAVAGDLAKVFSFPKDTSESNETSPPTLSGSHDIARSVEEHAFNPQKPLLTDADLVDDDVPRNTDFLGRELPTSEVLSAFETVNLDPPLLAPQVLSETDGETIRLLSSDAVHPVQDLLHTAASAAPTSSLTSPSFKLRVRDCDVSLELHDGFDWQSTQKAIETEVKSVRRRLEKIRQLLASGQTPDESVDQTGTTLFNSVYIGLPRYPSDADANAYLTAFGDDDLLGIDFADDTSQATSFQSVKGRPGGSSPLPVRIKSKRRRLTRSKHARIVIKLLQTRLAIEFFPTSSSIASNIKATVRDLEVLDQIKTSTWKKFLTEMRVDARGNTREADSHMVTLELRSVRLADDPSREEALLRAKVLPLRLHVDQDALDFLKRFFSFKDQKTSPSSDSDASKEIYLQHVEIFPIQLKLDYKPKRVDYKGLREGRTIELMNFFHFDGAEMTLRRITLSGVSGWPRLFETLNVLWTPDVKANQLADIITSIAPIRSLVNVGSGMADLVLLPLEQYNKDGRLVRGVQRGATSFVKSTAIEALKLGASLATGTQVVLERAEHVLGGGGPDRFGAGLTTEALAPSHGDELHSSSDDEVNEHHSRYANQPATIQEGVSKGYKSLSKNLNSAAETILAVPMEVYEKSGTDGPARAVVRAVPIAVLKPMIGASEAVSKTLFGLRNTIDPTARRDLEDKYK